MKPNREIISKNTDRLVKSFDKISRIFASMQSFARDISLSKPEILALEFISNSSGKEVIMSKVAKGLGISFSMATKVVDHLVERNLVDRDRNQEDRRVVRLSLTNGGKEIVIAYEKQKKNYFGKMLSLLTETEQEILNLAFEKIASSMSKNDNV